MVQRGYYPSAHDRLRDAVILAQTQDPVPAIGDVQSSAEEVKNEVVTNCREMYVWFCTSLVCLLIKRSSHR